MSVCPRIDVRVQEGLSVADWGLRQKDREINIREREGGERTSISPFSGFPFHAAPPCVPFLLFSLCPLSEVFVSILPPQRCPAS